MEYKLINGLYRLTDFDKAKEECEAFIQNSKNENTMRKARTLIRKKKEEIATFRKEANKALLYDFNYKCKTLEAMLDVADKQLTDIINLDKEPKPDSIIITCEVFDEKTLQKALQFLNELGLNPKTKAKTGGTNNG